MDWVRLYHDMPTDPKWRVIARKAGQRIGDVIAVYVFMLCNASCNTVKRGVTQGFVAEDVAAAIDLEADCVTAILGAMEGKVVKNGQLLGWEKRNPKREDSSTDRVRKHRETQGNALKRPDTDTDKNILGEQSPPSKPKGERRSSTALPDDFPLQADREAALGYWRERGRRDLCPKLDDQISAFRAHHAAHGKRMVDWSAAWRTWYGNAVRFEPPPKGQATLPLGGFDATDERGWRDRLQVFREKGSWSPKWGPKPTEPGCKCPREILTDTRTQQAAE